METRIIGGFECTRPASVYGLEKIREAVKKDIPKDQLLKLIDREIDLRWAIDGFWRNARLEPVYE